MIDISENIRKEESDLLRQAAEATASAKSAFLANMSREIRTPMNGVMGMLELLKGTSLNFHQHKYACSCCNSKESIKTAKKTPQILPKTNAAAGLLSYIATAKGVIKSPVHFLLRNR
ncbi:MAG: hypothetical protein KUG73_02535 [Pseudomonadales bacterium]|nr:hypothetical protein [Pseudomonadales bacterium]